MTHRHRARLSTWLLPLLLAVTALAAVDLARPDVAAAQADPRARAKEHYQRGTQLFTARDFEGAIREFRAADQLAPSGVNDYNIALAYEELQQYADAIRHYRSYLTRVPDAHNRYDVEQTIARLEAALAADEQRRIDAAAEARRAAEEEARLKAEAEEARRRAEEADAARRTAPPPGGDATAHTPAPTGDPELDRVAAIDVAAIRDQRGAAVAPPVAAAGGGPAVPPPGAPAPADQPAPPKAKPIYKQWWFWVVAGVSAYVLISIATADSDETYAREQPVPSPGPDRAGAGGFTLLRF